MTPTSSNAPPPDSLRDLCDPLHAEIRRTIRRVLDLTGRVKRHEDDAALALTDAMRDLALVVRRHVAAEQSELLPHLGSLDAWGAQRQEHIEKEHARELEAVFNIDYYGSHLAMAEDASSIARTLLRALKHEEDELSGADSEPSDQEAG